MPDELGDEAFLVVRSRWQPSAWRPRRDDRNDKAGPHPSVRPAWSCCCLKQRAPERTRTSNLLIRSPG